MCFTTYEQHVKSPHTQLLLQRTFLHGRLQSTAHGSNLKQHSTLRDDAAELPQSATFTIVHMFVGLDARAAAIVMRVVRNIVNTGRTIACTIHQPAIDIFEVRTKCICLHRK